MTEESQIKPETQENQDNSNKDSSDNKQIAELNEKISDLESVINNLNDKLLRSLADLDNTRRRAKEDLEKANKYAISNFANDLVLVAENFYLATDNMPSEEIEKSPAIKNFTDAVIMTKKELTKIFEKNSIKRIYPLGEKFDHNFHEAIARIESEDDEEVVKQVIQAGYTIGDRLIRPALVGVSVKPNS